MTASLLFVVAQRYGMAAAAISFTLRCAIILTMSTLVDKRSCRFSFVRDLLYKSLIFMATDLLVDDNVTVKIAGNVLTSLEGIAYMLVFMYLGEYSTCNYIYL